MPASIYADVIDSRALEQPETLLPTLGETARRLNQVFAPALAVPFAVDFGDELRGALDDPVQAPLCVSVMREALAPMQVRVGVAFGASAEDAFTEAKKGDRLVHFMGTGEAGDLLLNALCRMVDPLVRSRTPKQWEAVAAMRAAGDAKGAAQRLGISRQGLVARLKGAHWKAVEDADATIAAYLAMALPAS